MQQKVIKRDGQIVDFDSSKITNAICKASNATKEMDTFTARRLTKNVMKIVNDFVKEKQSNLEAPTVEEIQDIVEKVLESYNDVFADIVNVLLFDGEEVLMPDELEEQAPRAAYKADGRYREMERDVCKRLKKENIRVACIGLENQTVSDRDMPLRIMGYDGAEYRGQLNGEQKERYPVITLVLYFDHKKHWNGPLSLKECFTVSERFDPFVNDCKVNLFEIAYLSDEKVKQFRSDFRVVADYFVQKRKTNDYIPDSRQLDHVQETLNLLSVMTNDRRFEKVANDAAVAEGGKEIHNMCEVLDRIENRGMEKGIKKGKEETLTGLVKDGLLSVTDAAKRLGITEEAFRKKYLEA